MSTNSSTILFAEAEKIGLTPCWETEYGVFSFVFNQRRHYLFQSYTPLNSQLAGYYSRNKHVTRLLLEEIGMPNIPSLLPQTFKNLEDFFSLYKKLIAKPLESAQSRGVLLIERYEQLSTVDFKHLFFEQYIEGTEYRYLILDKKVIAVQQRINIGQPTVWAKKRTNIAQENWNQELIEKALVIAETMNLRLCAVDFIIDIHSKKWVLEVNSTPGLRPFYEPDEGFANPVGQAILAAILNTLSSRQYFD